MRGAASHPRRGSPHRANREVNVIIRIRYSGGFAGLEQDLGIIDTSVLTEPERIRIEQSVEELPDVAAKPGDVAGADLFRYDIHVRGDAGEDMIFTVFQEGDPESLPPRPVQTLLEAMS